MSLKDAILSAPDCKPEKQDVPEWGDGIHLRQMTGTERDQWERAVFKDGVSQRDDLFAKLLVRCICDASGARVFSDEDAPALSGKGSTILLRLYGVAAKLNGIGKEDEEELIKNSSSAPADSSHSV